jgi:hypothetical protein
MCLHSYFDGISVGDGVDTLSGDCSLAGCNVSAAWDPTS